MARLPRIVVPNQPLHIMHRGNNRQDIFESVEDMSRIKEDVAQNGLKITRKYLLRETAPNKNSK